MRAFLTPKWLGLHALLAGSLYAFWRLGSWQWGKGEHHGSWVNSAYGVQWWLFAAFAVFLYVKLVLDELDPSRVEERDEQAALPELPPVVQISAPPPADDEDDELAAYNRYLRSLHEGSQR